ncbi:MAG: type II secretion system F family protein [Verrucomicrobiota bacterium]
MPTFSYTAVDSTGQQLMGTIEANNQTEASAQVKQQGLYPTSLVEAAAGAPQSQSAAVVGQKQKTGGAKKVAGKTLMVFTRQLATLIDAGLPLVRSLKTLITQEKHPGLKSIVSTIAETVESGSTFSEALAQHPKTFDRLYVNMVKAGEIGGVLETVLLRLAEFKEKSQRIRAKVLAAMTYPAVVLVIAVFIMAFLMLFIVPKFETIFRDMLGNKPLPAITQIVVSFSDIVMQACYPIPYLPIGIILIAVGYKFMSGTPAGSAFIDKFKLKMPIFGDLLTKTAIARFTRTLGTLVSSGVPILQALNITKETAGNTVISDAIIKVHDSVKEGESMVNPLDASGLFPPMVISMIQVGEETGQLPDMLTKVADVYEDEVDTAVSSLTSLLEPIMIVVLAVIVGTIVVALFYPLISIIQNLSAI